jgi:hypothetical protein
MDALQKFLQYAATLPLPAKLLLSAAVVFLSALVLVVIWTPQAVPDGGMWPKDRTIQGLRRRLDGLSAMNARVLKVVAHGGQYGVYPADVEKALKIDRDAAVLRAKELESGGLLKIQSLTDLNFRIDSGVVDVLRPGDAAQFFDGYLPDK